MTDEFQRPFAPPPVIFGVALLIGLGVDFIYPIPMIPLALQLALGATAVISGVLFILSSMKRIHRAGTTYNPYAASTALVISGIYQYTRNPGYLGLMVIQFGLALMIDSPWIAITAIAAVIVTNHFVIRLEEQKLTDTFGQEYQDYLTQVRRWI
jgi:protein-S-isoprenylcysteine O-methyltransferase Ste14